MLHVSDEMQETTPNGLVKKVGEFIKSSPQGVSIQDVAKQFNISRYQANGVLGILIGAGKIGVRQIGPVKVHYWKGGE